MAVSMVCGNFTRFTTAKDDPNLGAKFTDWLAKFENELIAWGVDDDRQRKALLLSHAGDGAWEKWLTCTTEEKGDDKAYDSAKKTLSDYFDKKRDPDFEVTKCRECVQKPEQSIDSYVTQLRSLARYCDFGNRADDEIKLQIKLNCASSRLRRKAFAEPQWKLDDLVKYARALEISNKQASEIEHIPTNVNAVKFVRSRQQGAARAPVTRNRQPRDRQAPMNKSNNNTCGNWIRIPSSSDGGMKPDPKKVEDIQNLEPPTNVKELRSVLGMTGYSSRFIPDYATITAPLRELTHKNSSWNWTTTHQEAFETLKEKLQSAPALAYFDISKSTEIAVDASPVGLGAILTQKDENGHSHVIAYGSRSLTKTEQNYSQTEREALAIVWGCEHYHLYCYGKALTVFTDHKPLTSIFNNPLSKPTPRIERWSLRLQPYQPNKVYAPGPDNPADYMSRHPKKQIEVNSREEKIAEEYINFVSQHAVPIAIDLEEVKSATLNDHTLQRVIECIRNGSWYKKDAQDLRLDNRAFNSYVPDGQR
ncbi:hypothetical protein QZH41_015863 [Actinostola sp. cb2023]|nr:hypothetical protein QZH41_015863 [Actinostola sp. cb2023]